MDSIQQLWNMLTFLKSWPERFGNSLSHAALTPCECVIATLFSAKWSTLVKAINSATWADLMSTFITSGLKELFSLGAFLLNYIVIMELILPDKCFLLNLIYYATVSLYLSQFPGLFEQINSTVKVLLTSGHDTVTAIMKSQQLWATGPRVNSLSWKVERFVRSNLSTVNYWLWIDCGRRGVIVFSWGPAGELTRL